MGHPVPRRLGAMVSMALVALRMEQSDLDQLREQAAAMRVPYTVLARALIVQGLRMKELKFMDQEAPVDMSSTG
jgi:hypothetical protein